MESGIYQEELSAFILYGGLIAKLWIWNYKNGAFDSRQSSGVPLDYCVNNTVSRRTCCFDSCKQESLVKRKTKRGGVYIELFVISSSLQQRTWSYRKHLRLPTTHRTILLERWEHLLSVPLFNRFCTFEEHINPCNYPNYQTLYWHSFVVGGPNIISKEISKENKDKCWIGFHDNVYSTLTMF